MTLLSNISILVLILAVIAISILYARLLKRSMKEIRLPPPRRQPVKQVPENETAHQSLDTAGGNHSDR